MKPPARLFVNAVRSFADARGLAILAAGAAVAGCMSNPFQDAQVDPGSPIAAEVERVARANTDFPSFSEIPRKPDDVRPLRMFGESAREVELAGLKLERETAPETWTLQNTEGFVSQAQRDVGPELEPADPKATEAFVNEQMRRATPPPPPKR